MQQAFVVFTRDGVFRVGQIKGNRRIFNHYCSLRSGEEVGEHLAEGFGGHDSRLFTRFAGGSVTSEHRICVESEDARPYRQVFSVKFHSETRRSIPGSVTLQSAFRNPAPRPLMG